MTDKHEVTRLKNIIKASVFHNSDRGFVPYSGCMKVCGEMHTVMKTAEHYIELQDYHQAFDIYIMVLVEAVKLVSHSDDSSGCCGDVIYNCLIEIDKLCRITSQDNDNYFFDTIIKTAKNKVFEDWSEWAYSLLKSAVYFVHNNKQAQKIYDLFPVLGKMYSGSDYPDKLLITLGIIERLEGKDAANKYIMDNINVPEYRVIAIENAIVIKDYKLAEKLCKDALSQNIPGSFTRRKPWAYFLEQIYKETDNTDALITTVRYILLKGDTSYFRKLKALYEQQGTWYKEREPLWHELPDKIGIQNYVTLLSQEEELELLFEAVKQYKFHIELYGEQLAAKYPEEVYSIYEEYILDEAQKATDRGKYKRVCNIIKSFANAVGKTQAIALIEHLCEDYPRRPAMLDELSKLMKRLNK